MPAGVSGRDEAFASGLLCDIGLLAACQSVYDEYESVLIAAEETGEPLTDIEQRIIGITHPEIGAALMRKWHLPDMLCEAVAGHHGPVPKAPGDQLLLFAESLWAGSAISNVLARDAPGDDLDETLDQCRIATGLGRDALRGVVKQTYAQMGELADLLSLDADGVAYPPDHQERFMAALAQGGVDSG